MLAVALAFVALELAMSAPAGVVRTPGNVRAEERGDPIWVCRSQKVSWAGAWPGARHYG